MGKHVISDLWQMQSLPLEAKIRMTKYRIRQWVEYYGEDGVYVSFSGGKDSTVLLDLPFNYLLYLLMLSAMICSSLSGSGGLHTSLLTLCNS